jgi:hypothetical protein
LRCHHLPIFLPSFSSLPSSSHVPRALHSQIH